MKSHGIIILLENGFRAIPPSSVGIDCRNDGQRRTMDGKGAQSGHGGSPYSSSRYAGCRDRPPACPDEGQPRRTGQARRPVPTANNSIIGTPSLLAEDFFNKPLMRPVRPLMIDAGRMRRGRRSPFRITVFASGRKRPPQTNARARAEDGFALRHPGRAGAHFPAFAVTAFRRDARESPRGKRVFSSTRGGRKWNERFRFDPRSASGIQRGRIRPQPAPPPARWRPPAAGARTWIPGSGRAHFPAIAAYARPGGPETAAVLSCLVRRGNFRKFR